MSRAFTSLVLISALVVAPAVFADACHCDEAGSTSSCIFSDSDGGSDCDSYCDLPEFLPSKVMNKQLPSSDNPSSAFSITDQINDSKTQQIDPFFKQYKIFYRKTASFCPLLI